MDLPTYTNIWRIEKRLYKLYDLRLPMPLPLVQIGVFVGVFVPWIMLLKFVGIPFRTPWHVLYLVPPGVLTWLATRPVIEGKRLTELLLSQSRYLTEPRTWCRLTPIREPREVVVVARVWRQTGPMRPVTAAEKAAVRAGRKAREAQRNKKGRGRNAPVRVPGPAGAAAHTTEPALASFVADRPTQAAAPRPLEQYAAQATLGGHAGTAAPATFGTDARRTTAREADAPRPDEAPATGVRGGAAPMPQRADGHRAASAWRPRTRRDISHEPEPTTEPLPTAGTASVRESARAEPPPATPTLEVTARPDRTTTDESARAGLAPAGPAAPSAADSAPAQASPAERGDDAVSEPRPVGSGKRGLASGVRRPGAAAEFWRAIAPPERAEPAQGESAPAERASAEPVRPDRAQVERAQAERAQVEGAQIGTAEEERAPAERPRAEEAESSGDRAGERAATPPVATAAEGPAPAEDDPGVKDPRVDDRPTGDQGRSEPPAAESPAATTRPDISQVPAATTLPDIPAVPEAFGATGVPVGASAGEEAQTEEAETPRPEEERPAAPQPVVQAPAGAADTGAGSSAEAGPSAEGRSPEDQSADASATDEPGERGRQVRREPPKPWSEGLSRPLRDPNSDAQVWPPPRLPQGGSPGQPRRSAPPRRPAETGPSRGGAPARASGPTGVPSTGQQPPAGPPPRAQGFATAAPPPTGPDGVPPGESVPPVPPVRPVAPPPPYQHEQAPAREAPQIPQNRPGPPAGQPPPPVTPEPPGRVSWRPAPPESQPGSQHGPQHGPQAEVPQEYAPAREVRSGPASPVRPRPLPPPPSPPAPPQAITPPDPEHEGTPGGLRRLIQAVGGGHSHVDEEYEERLQRPFHGTRRIVVLGCTGGAGQTVTALMLGHTFAQYCAEPVVAIDVNPGPGALARRTRSETNETLTGLITRADQVNTLTAMRRYASQAKSGLDVITAGKNPLQALDDRDYALAIRTVDRFYSVTLLDAAAAVVARVLPHADQIVLVAPASADAPRAVAMTFEWLDGHGYSQSRSQAVTVINGVSRRSMDDVEQAESVARGRCRALVRIPWDDHLSLDRSPRNELKSLRAPTRRAYLALAGVVAGGFVAQPERYQQQEASR
ncbi:TcpE family conjugal transfer membrane protein [Actinomadura sp. HBU206391]|uniref:TcpE family conjugal transfer membrane protein n=1 Tax=Actinomadura sp. HBU206391 TaxID=2731692 RepID=UPI0016509015|nr:conjugal transfer protein [Actinomadura sp. HBU206391]MBC6457508.1 hypothetical protein [Actinomadura sp. HBU206391]